MHILVHYIFESNDHFLIILELVVPSIVSACAVFNRTGISSGCVSNNLLIHKSVRYLVWDSVRAGTVSVLFLNSIFSI
jgi:hypothetical protein